MVPRVNGLALSQRCGKPLSRSQFTQYQYQEKPRIDFLLMEGEMWLHVNPIG